MALLQVGATAAMRLPPGILDRLVALTARSMRVRKSRTSKPNRRRVVSTMSTLVERWEASFLRHGGVGLSFDAPSWFSPDGPVIRAIGDMDTGCLNVVWQDGTVALFRDAAELDVTGGLEVTWTADGLLRGAGIVVACKSK